MIEGTAEEFLSFANFFYKHDSAGKTLYAHHLDLYEQLGVVSKELEEPPSISGAFSHVKDWFEDLSFARINYVGMAFAYAPIQISEIESYLRLKRIEYHTVEIDVLLMLDRIFLSIMNKSEKET